jgi:hypothetical protein
MKAQSKEDESSEACSVMWEKTNAYKIFVVKPEEKGPLGRHRCRWERDNKLNLRETGWKDVKLIHLAPDRECCWLK